MMNHFQRILDAGQAIAIGFSDCCSSALDSLDSAWTWLLQPQQDNRRFYTALKCIAYITPAAAFSLYIGWTGNELSQQANRLAAKQICNGNVSNVVDVTGAIIANQSRRTKSVEDQEWCDDPDNNKPLSIIMSSAVTTILSTPKWLYAKLAAVLCGAHSLHEEGLETCLSVGLLVAAYLVSRTSFSHRHIEPELAQELFISLVSVLDNRWSLGVTSFSRRQGT